MQNWYNNLATGQKLFAYAISIALPFFALTALEGSDVGDVGWLIFLASASPLAILIFLKLGSKK